MSEQPVVVVEHDGWAEVVLNRPERRNAVDLGLSEALAASLRRLDADSSVRALLLRGAGGTFCSGMDLGDVAAGTGAGAGAPSWPEERTRAWGAVHVALAGRHTPIVVALERYAINAGAALALAADLVVAGQGARLQVGEVGLGMGAPMCQLWLRLRHSPMATRRLVLVGDRVGADDLQRLGVVSEVVPPDEVVDRAGALTAAIAAHPPAGLAAVQGVEDQLDRALDPAVADGVAEFLSGQAAHR